MPPTHFLLGIFKIGSHELLAQDWLQAMIFLISASWVARITGVSHHRPALLRFLRWGLATLLRLALNSWTQVIFLP
jgi:hypothetical protein